MFRNYMKITIRNIFKDKLHSVINILGLSLGISVAVMIYLFVSNEFSYDTFHQNADRIYEVSHTRFDADGSPEGYFVHAPIPFGPALEQEIPEIEHAIRFSEEETFVRSKKLTAEEKIIMADRSFFSAFTFPFKSGNSSSVLDERYSCVMTAELANKYFGTADPVGKTIDVLLGEDYIPLTVTGVVSEIPSNSSIEFDIIAPYDLLNRFEWFRSRQDSWNSWNSPTFMILKENADIKEVEQKMIPFWEKYMGENFAEQRANGEWKFDFQPIKTKFIPLPQVRHSELRFSGIAKTSDPMYAYILGAIGVGILLLACINFMNLSISRAATRTKEIGVRKVIGAAKRNLFFQFLGEALILSFTAMLFALVVVSIVLPLFNSIIGSNLSIDLLKNWQTLAAIIIITFFAGLIAGIYPAVIMSSLKPVQIFSRKIAFGGSNLFTRFLIVLQFSLAIFFILGTLVISEQLSFIQNKDLGFDKEQIVVIRSNYQKVDGSRIMNIFKSKFGNDADIAGIAGISYSFTRGYDRIGWKDSKEVERIVYAYRVDENLINLLDIKVLEGRNFSREFSTDSTDAVIVNEALVKQFEIEDPVGTRLDGFKNRGLDNPVIIGVVKDFHYISLERRIEPSIMYINPLDQIYYIYAKLNPNRISSGLEKLKSEWNSIEPEIPFQYSFLDEDLDNQYAEAQLRQRVINYSAGFAIFIAAIGLFGMSSYSAEKRRKEIGIRKVLGASVRSIVSLLSREFAVLVLIANIIAWPAAYFVMSNWLDNFAYRISLGLWVFVIGGVIALMIAVLTVSYQVIKTSISNPVDSIREE